MVDWQEPPAHVRSVAVSGAPDSLEARVWDEREILSASTSQLAALLLPEFRGEIVDSEWRNLHPGSFKILSLYEPMQAISPGVCRQTVHAVGFAASVGQGPAFGRVLTTSGEGSIYLAAENGVCLTPGQGMRGFDARQVDVGDSLDKFRAVLSTETPQVDCGPRVVNCSAVLRSLQLGSLRSLYGCYRTDCVATFEFPITDVGRAQWGWRVELYNTPTGGRLTIAERLPPPVS